MRPVAHSRGTHSGGTRHIHEAHSRGTCFFRGARRTPQAWSVRPHRVHTGTARPRPPCISGSWHRWLCSAAHGTHIIACGAWPNEVRSRIQTKPQSQTLAPCGRPYRTRGVNQKPCIFPRSRFRFTQKAGVTSRRGLGWIRDGTSTARNESELAQVSITASPTVPGQHPITTETQERFFTALSTSVRRRSAFSNTSKTVQNIRSMRETI